MIITENGMYEIEHLGKKCSSRHFKDLSDEECDAIREEYFLKPTHQEVLRELYNISRGSCNISKSNLYYVRDLMNDAKLSTQTWSINEFMQCNDLIRYACGKILAFPKVFETTSSFATNMDVFFRIGSSMTATKISNYPLDSVHEVIKKYNTNGNYYDFSCGWGVRLLGAMNKNINYFGTDPNDKLFVQLLKMKDDYKKVTKNISIVDIRNHGSEIFVEEWIGKMGLIFSSPPYFNLEDYVHGDNQSIKINEDYQDWLENYWRGTVKNIFKYISDDGNFLLNIKNLKKYNLLDDMRDIAIEEGFFYHHSLELKNIQRSILTQNKLSSNEKILVFTKQSEFKTENTFDEWS
jgi:hypothetical protein